MLYGSLRHYKFYEFQLSGSVLDSGDEGEGVFRGTVTFSKKITKNKNSIRFLSLLIIVGDCSEQSYR